MKEIDEETLAETIELLNKKMDEIINKQKDLEKELRESLESLKDNLISVANEEHRQLIIIDLL